MSPNPTFASVSGYHKTTRLSTSASEAAFALKLSMAERARAPYGRARVPDAQPVYWAHHDLAVEEHHLPRLDET
jgi:hypothetical protein